MLNDPSIDNNKMGLIMYFHHFLKTLKLVFIIMNISYFVGMGWLIQCRVIESYKEKKSLTLDENQIDLHADGHSDMDEEAFIFINKFGLFKMDSNQQALASVYYAFTSLSTVGFGDYYPCSDMERIICAIMLLFGVAIFSFVMGKFIEMIEKVQEFDAVLDKSDQLSQFFGVLKKFNNNTPINANLKNEIE